MAVGQRGGVDAPGCQVVDEHGGGHEVHDGIHRANLMEMHLVGRGTVRRGLGIGKDLERAARNGPGAVGHGDGIHDGEAVGQVPMGVVVMVFGGGGVLLVCVPMPVQIRHVVVVRLAVREHHVEVARVESRDRTAVHPHLELPRHGQARQHGTQPLLARTRVQQRGDQHVPR